MKPALMALRRACAVAVLFASAAPALAVVLADRLAPQSCQGDGEALALPPTLPSAALVAELLHWIDAATSYDIAAALANPPEISFCSKGESIRYEDDILIVPNDLRAAYDWPNRRILLVQPWSADNPRDRSALLHELVHHVQLLNRGFDCPQASEWETYKLQDAWLTENDVESGFDWLLIYMASRCPRDHHP